MKTGKDVSKRGLYVTDCCLQERLFEKGDSFSRCPQCWKLADWELVDVATDSKVVNVGRNDSYEAA